jgi:hypothetical protein
MRNSAIFERPGDDKFYRMWKDPGSFFFFSLTVHLSITLANDQLDAQIFNTPITILYISVSQTPGHGPVPVPGINYTGPRVVLLEVVILVF